MIRRDAALDHFILMLDIYIDARISNSNGADNDTSCSVKRTRLLDALDDLLDAQSEETERHVRNERSK